ncbi:hypothetical protein Droror1_Dr00014750 [Drosera rotundifolia]
MLMLKSLPILLSMPYSPTREKFVSLAPVLLFKKEFMTSYKGGKFLNVDILQVLIHCIHAWNDLEKNSVALFCKCLRSAADRCGQRCPKRRQQISKIRSCTINTVLWNTIQLLFPGEVEARKKAASKFELDQDVKNEIHKTAHQHDINESVRCTPRRASIATSSSSIRFNEENDTDKAIPLPNVTLTILAMVIEYCKKHAGPEPEDCVAKDALKEWDAKFANVDQMVMFVLLLDFTEYTNFDECLQYIQECMINFGPIDGFLGFSLARRGE